jgi:hypothetical protein
LSALECLIAEPAGGAVTGVTLDQQTSTRPSDLGFVTLDPSLEGARYTGEEWRPVPAWPYEVSSLGRVRTPMRIDDNGCLHVSRLLAQTLDEDGYPCVMLHAGGRRRKARVHCLVLEAHVGPRPSRSHQACHWNGVRTDNRKCNLRWGTRADQEEDKRRHRQERRHPQRQVHPVAASLGHDREQARARLDQEREQARARLAGTGLWNRPGQASSHEVRAGMSNEVRHP